MLLAGDIGGTKSRLAIFADGGSPREPLAEEVLPSGRFAGIEALIRAFLKRTHLYRRTGPVSPLPDRSSTAGRR